jgi:hypothetical protein
MEQIQKTWMGETLNPMYFEDDGSRAEWWGKKPKSIRGTNNIQYHATDIEFTGTFDERGDRICVEIENPLPWSATIWYTNKRRHYECTGFGETEQEAKDIAEAKHAKLVKAYEEA